MTTTTVPLEQYLKEVSELKKTIESLNDTVSVLKEQLEWFKKQVFGQKTERFVEAKNEQQLCFEGFDKLVVDTSEEKQAVTAHQRAKKKSNGQDKITLPADLPIERQVIDVPEEAKICPETGEILVKIGDEVTSKLAHRPGSYFIKQLFVPSMPFQIRVRKGYL